MPWAWCRPRPHQNLGDVGETKCIICADSRLPADVRRAGNPRKGKLRREGEDINPRHRNREQNRSAVFSSDTSIGGRIKCFRRSLSRREVGGFPPRGKGRVVTGSSPHHRKERSADTASDSATSRDTSGKSDMPMSGLDVRFPGCLRRALPIGTDAPVAIKGDPRLQKAEKRLEMHRRCLKCKSFR